MCNILGVNDISYIVANLKSINNLIDEMLNLECDKNLPIFMNNDDMFMNNQDNNYVEYIADHDRNNFNKFIKKINNEYLNDLSLTIDEFIELKNKLYRNPYFVLIVNDLKYDSNSESDLVEIVKNFFDKMNANDLNQTILI